MGEPVPVCFPPVLEDGFIFHGFIVGSVAAVILAPLPADERAGVYKWSTAVVFFSVVGEEWLGEVLILVDGRKDSIRLVV